MDVGSIQLQVDGEVRSFAEWTGDFVDTYYPHLGQRCYRVPALHFNHQRLVGRKGLGQTELQVPDEGQARGDLAHTLVLDSLDHLGQQLQDGQGLFIISSLDYDNYLARVKAPPQSRGKENRPQHRTRVMSSKETKAETPLAPWGVWGNNSLSARPTSAIERPTAEPERPSSSHERPTSRHETPTSRPETPTSRHERPTSRREKPTSRHEMPTSTDERPTPRREKPTSRHERPTSRNERPTSRNDRPTRTELPPRPRDMSERGQRGDIDVVLLHQHCGVVLIEVKATGMPHPQWRYSDHDIRESVHKAMEQVKRGRDVFHFIMPDLSCSPCVTLVVALPFVARQQLDRVIEEMCLDADVLFLCQEDMVGNGQPDLSLPGHSSSLSAGSSQRVAPTVPDSPMVRWWNDVIAARGKALPLGDMKTIVGRVCGLLSIVSVWTRSKPRAEVRTAAQAISQAADRVSDIVLLPRQAGLLAHPSPARLCLTGPMGSGKTLMLQLKGRQWLREGRRVVVLNVRTSGRGRPIGHVLEQAIKRDDFEDGSVERHDLAVKEFDLVTFHAELERRGPTDQICFVLDELTHHSFFLLERLMRQYSDCSIWCVAMFVRRLPRGFQHFRLGAVLRSPPSVQLLLKELDLNPVHKDVYTTRSAARGLPCDGPPIIFIQHQQHGEGARPHDCLHCADQLVEVLRDKLGLVFPGQQQTLQLSSTTEPRSPRKPGRPEPQPKAIEAKPVSFKDILFLVCVPLDYYRQTDDGLWIAPVEDLFKYCDYLHSCPFITTLKNRGVPIKTVIDNTSREIAIPSTDEIIVTDVMGVHSLERKVVLFLPGGPVLDSNDSNGGQSVDSQASPCSVGKPASSSSSHRLPPPERPCTYQLPATGHPHSAPLAGNSGETKDCGIDPSPGNTVRHCRPPVRSVNDRPESVGTELIKTETEAPTPRPDTVSVQATGEESLTAGEDPSATERIKRQSDIQRVFGNMIVGDTHLTECSKGKLTLDAEEPNNKSNEGRTIRPRMGMDLRGDSPWLLSALEDAQKLQNSNSSRSSSNQDCHLSPNLDVGEEGGYFRADSVFLVPDVTQEVGQRGSELQRVRQAVSSLSMDDQDWLFMAAARCLSQLVVIVP